MKGLFLLLFASVFPVFGALPQEVSGKILYLIHKGSAKEAIDLYLEQADEPDYTLLQQIGSGLIAEGARSEDPETFLMALFGAGISTTPDLLPILEKGLRSQEMKHQLTALNFLAKMHDDEATLLMEQALSSPFLLVRLESAFLLAGKGKEGVIENLRSLLVKVPKEAKALFAQIASKVDSPDANRFYRELLADSQEQVRVEAISEAVKAKRDDFLPQIRALATHPDRSQQEAALVALGKFKDESSTSLLHKLDNGPNHLAAWYALYLLGETQISSKIEREAHEGNLHAISMLGEMDEEKSLERLLHSQDANITLNAILGLLQKKNPEVSSHLKEILIRDERDLGFVPYPSPGRALTAWKVIPLATHRTKFHPAIMMQTQMLREKVLQACLELPEEQFLEVAKLVFAHQQNDLIPLLTQLLSNQHSPKAIDLLKENQQKAGAPFIRNYCTLALYQLNEEGPYEDQLVKWARQQESQELIRFKESNDKEISLRYELNPEQTSQFLIEVFESLASSRREIGVGALLHAIAYGNPKNKYALAGLLIRTAE